MPGANETAQRARVLAAKAEALSSILKTHTVEE